MSKEVETARKILVEDLKNAPHVLSSPLGHGVTQKKIHQYLFECVLGGVDKTNCCDWLYDLYKNQTDEEHDRFQLAVDSMAISLYEFHDFLRKYKRIQ